MKLIATTGASIAVVLLVVTIIVMWDVLVQRNYRRFMLSRRAQRVAARTGKPLLVIGSPYLGGISGTIAKWLGLYPCGDICVDIQGCQTCPNQSSMHAEQFLALQKPDSHVIFISCVLEYIDDIEGTIEQLRRVSGGDLFVVFIDNPIDFLMSGSYIDVSTGQYIQRRWKILAAPPLSSGFAYEAFPNPYSKYNRAAAEKFINHVK